MIISIRTARIIAMTLLALMFSQSPALAAKRSDYEALVAQAKSGAPNVDYGKLRAAYAKTRDYDPYSFKIRNLTIEMNKAAAAGDYQGALKQARRIIDIQFVSIDAHFAAAHCYEMLGKPEDARRERSIGQELIKSILKSGDGKSPETAFVVVTLREEYALIAAMKARLVRQALMQQGGNVYDRMEVTPIAANDSSETRTLYFRINSIFGKLGDTIRKSGTARRSGAPKGNDSTK